MNRGLRSLPVVVLLFHLILHPGASGADRAQIEKQIRRLESEVRSHELQIRSLYEEITTRGREFLDPPKEDVERFSAFLKQPDTGIVRLLPRDRFERSLPVMVRSGASSFSFARLKHGGTADLELRTGSFFVGASRESRPVAQLGFLTAIGSVPLVNLTADHPAVEQLGKLALPKRLAEVREQRRRIHVTPEGLLMSRFQDAAADTTYVLRSTIFGSSDLIVAFQVVRVDSDGSMILLWKVLRRYSVPRLQS